MSHPHYSQTKPDFRWFRLFEPLSSFRGNLIAFHHAGGNYLIYRNWMYLRKRGFRLCLLSLPGRLDSVSEPFNMNLEQVINEVYKQSLHFIDEPYILFGHSMGGLIAYELIHLIQAKKHNLPSHLFISSTRSPQTQISNPPIHTLPDEAFVQEMVSYGGMPSEVICNQEFLNLVVPTLKKDFQLLSQYQYQKRPALSTPLIMIYGKDDPKLTLENTENWENETTGYYKQHIFPGGHFYLTDQHQEIQKLIWQEAVSSY